MVAMVPVASTAQLASPCSAVPMQNSAKFILCDRMVYPIFDDLRERERCFPNHLSRRARVTSTAASGSADLIHRMELQVRGLLRDVARRMAGFCPPTRPHLQGGELGLGRGVGTNNEGHLHCRQLKNASERAAHPAHAAAQSPPHQRAPGASRATLTSPAAWGNPSSLIAIRAAQIHDLHLSLSHSLHLSLSLSLNPMDDGRRCRPQSGPHEILPSTTAPWCRTAAAWLWPSPGTAQHMRSRGREGQCPLYGGGPL